MNRPIRSLIRSRLSQMTPRLAGPNRSLPERAYCRHTLARYTTLLGLVKEINVKQFNRKRFLQVAGLAGSALGVGASAAAGAEDSVQDNAGRPKQIKAHTMEVPPGARAIISVPRRMPVAAVVGVLVVGCGPTGNVVFWGEGASPKDWPSDEPGAYVDLRRIVGKIEKADQSHVKYFLDLKPGGNRWCSTP